MNCYTKIIKSDAKTPWSWGRMYGILSEGREIESRRQLEQLIERIGNENRHAHEQPLTSERARTRGLDRELLRGKERLDSKDVD